MSGYLLDTHVPLWAGIGSDRLSPATPSLLNDPGTDVRFSVVSIREAVNKSQLGRSDLQVDPEAIRAYARLSGMRELPVLGEHVLGILALPDLHRDPFDRLLIAQARLEKLTLLTVDQAVLAYGEGVEHA